MLTSRIEKTGDKRLRQTLLIGFLLAAVTLTLYWPVQYFDFVNFDDNAYVTEKPRVQPGLSLDGLIWAFTNLEAGFWQPLVWLSHMLDCQLFGLNAGGHHLTSVLLHCASTVLLLLVLQSMTGALWSSALVAALFAIHPLHVESVAWVAERKDVLSGLFWVLTLGAYVYYTRQPTLRRYLLVLLSYILGLLSKPIVVTLPFVLILLDYWPLRRFATVQATFCQLHDCAPAFLRTPLSRLVAEKMPLVILSCIAGVITWVAELNVGAINNMVSYPLGVRLVNAVVSYAAYLRKTIWPTDLAVFYPHFGMPPLWQVTVSTVLMIAITGIVLRYRKEAPFMTVGWFCYMGTLVPVIGLVQIGSHAMADRYTYLPLIGIFIAVSWGAKSIVERRSELKRPVFVFFLVSLSGLLILARGQVETWQNDFTLFGHALKVTEDNPLAHNGLGTAYVVSEGSCNKAIPHYVKALEISKDYAEAYFNLGICAIRDGNDAMAMTYFHKASAVNPRYAKARVNVGLMLLREEKLDEAKEEFHQILRMNPLHDEAHANLGEIFIHQGKLADAERHLREALRINPGNAQTHNNLGVVFMRQGRLKEALGQFSQALALEPGHRNAERNLQIVLGDTAS